MSKKRIFNDPLKRGNPIFEFRRKHGLSQKDAAKLINTRLCDITFWETYEKHIPAELLKLLKEDKNNLDWRGFKENRYVSSLYNNEVERLLKLINKHIDASVKKMNLNKSAISIMGREYNRNDFLPAIIDFLNN